MRTHTHTHTHRRAIRHACTHGEAYGRYIVIRRDDCTSWYTSPCNRCASPSAITCVSTTVKARMCTGCNSIYLYERVRTHTYVRMGDALTAPLSSECCLFSLFVFLSLPIFLSLVKYVTSRPSFIRCQRNNLEIVK